MIKMTRAEEIKILMEDNCTKAEAEKHLNNGSIVFEDFEENLESYIEELSMGDEEDAEEYRTMVRTKKPRGDWGVVEQDGKTYYIMYCL